MRIRDNKLRGNGITKMNGRTGSGLRKQGRICGKRNVRGKGIKEYGKRGKKRSKGKLKTKREDAENIKRIKEV